MEEMIPAGLRDHMYVSVGQQCLPFPEEGKQAGAKNYAPSLLLNSCTKSRSYGSPNPDCQ